MANKEFANPLFHQNISDLNPSTEDMSSPFLFENQPIGSFQTHLQNSDSKKQPKSLSISSTRFAPKTSTSPFLQEQTSVPYDSTDVTHSCVASSPINGPSFIQILEHLDLSSFKTKPCHITTQHNHKHCQFYHNSKDRKRVGNFYSSELCEYAEKDGLVCANKDLCPKAHNRVEQLYQPEKYKTKFCTFYPHNLEKCDYGIYCSFAHHENDISIELIHNYEFDDDFYMFHFKTVWCPFNLTQHDKALCVYAHNWQDYRRKPHVHSYETSSCPTWKSTDFIVNYQDGCPLKEKCSRCHGWKEYEYHPCNYKTKPCPSGIKCNKGRDCPHYHAPRERRIISPHILSRVFKYVPRNRIITNTFKVRSGKERGYEVQTESASSNIPVSTMSGHPSFTLSQEGELFTDQFPILPGMITKEAGKSSVLSAMTPKDIQTQEIRPRNQSFNLEHNRPRINSGNAATLLPKNESLLTGQEHMFSKSNIEKPRRWSTNEQGGFSGGNDQLFREVMMSLKKESMPEDSNNPYMRSSEEIDEADRLEDIEQDLKNSLMLHKILESEEAELHH